AAAGWIREAAEVARGEHEHLLVVVDSVHSWAEAFPGDVAEYDRLNLAIGALRSLARGLGRPVLAIAQRNRASMPTGGMNAAAARGRGAARRGAPVAGPARPGWGVALPALRRPRRAGRALAPAGAARAGGRGSRVRGRARPCAGTGPAA